MTHKPLSKLYRNDDANSIDPLMRTYLDVEYLFNLKNVHALNPKVLVVFSGGSAMGKSSLSARIGAELNGLVIENDGIKRALLKMMPDIDKQDELNILTWQYGMDLYRRLHTITSNGLIVRDGIIDWYFDRILPIFEKAGYRLFIIQYDISKEKAAELILRRGDTPTASADTLLQQLDDHIIHHIRFRNAYKADVILNEENLFDHDDVVTKLKSLIATLNTETS